MKTLKVGVLFLAFMGLVLGSLYPQQASFSGSKPKKITVRPPAGKPFLSNLTPAQIEGVISKLSCPDMLEFAKMHGLTSIKGKDITKMAASKTGRERAMFSDRPVSASDDANERDASIAVRPNNANIVVAAYWGGSGGASHIAYSRTSLDKGETWSDAHLLPARYAGDDVFTPVVRYAPNSSYVYAVYQSRRPDLSADDIMLSRSTNNGATWGKPLVVFSSGDYDSDGYTDWVSYPSVDVHYFAGTSSANPYVFVTCTVLEDDGGTRALFRRSATSASTLDNATWELSAVDDPGYVAGARAIGGRSADVLVVAFGTNGIDNPSYPFYILSWSSTANGASWANSAESQEIWDQVPFWLGPNETYGKWTWRASFPSVAMTPGGVAYVAYAADPVPGSADAEDGDIYVIKSPRPYSTWSRPEDLTYSFWGSQGFPAIGTKKTANGTVVFVAYEDHNYSQLDNELYDISMMYTGQGGGWRYARVTDVSSINAVEGQIRMDCSASSITTDKVLHVIWTDRADMTDFYDPESDVYCDLIELIW